MIDTGEQRQTGRKRTELHRKEPKESKQLPFISRFLITFSCFTSSDSQKRGGWNKNICLSYKHVTKGWSWNSNPGVPRSWITQRCNTILKHKGRGLSSPRDFNASLRFSLNSTATFSWQMRPSFSLKRQQQKLTQHDPPLACKYTCLVQGWATIQAGANLSSFTQGKKNTSPFPVVRAVRFQLGSW